MPKETFGGDDEGGAAPAEQKRKLDLSRFSKGQDMNIREVFWEVASAYASGENPSAELAKLSNERIALTRVAIGAVGSPSPLHGRLTPNRIAACALMMMLDAGWEDCFVEMLEECERREPQRNAVVGGLKRLCAEKEYSERAIASLRAMLRSRDNSPTALRYLGGMKSPGLVREMKRELIIFARGDIGENQLNAIALLSMLGKDEDVLRTMALLLSHWDESARKAAAAVLLKAKGEEASAAAKRRLEKETDPEVRAMLQKVAKG